MLYSPKQQRCDAAHEGTRTAHFCCEHGSPLKRNLDALEAECSSPLAGADDLNLDQGASGLSLEQLETWMQTSLDPDSAGAELVGDV